MFTIKKAVLRKPLVRFRLGVSPLKTHCLRYAERTPDIFTGPFCDTNESKIHFLLVCPKYKTLRETYLPAKFYNRPSAFKVAILLADTRHFYRSKQRGPSLIGYCESHAFVLLSLIVVLVSALACVCVICVRAREYVGVRACVSEFELV